MIMDKYYRDEAVELIDGLPGKLFADNGLEKQALLADEVTMERVWALYQKAVADYGMEPMEAIFDALQGACGIPMAELDGRVDYVDLDAATIVWEDPDDRTRTVRTVVSVPNFVIGLDPSGSKLLAYLKSVVEEYAGTAAGAIALRPKEGPLRYMDLLKISPAWLATKHIFLSNPDEAPTLTLGMDEPLSEGSTGSPGGAKGWCRVRIVRSGYAVVPAGDQEAVLAYAKQLGKEDFDWEPVDDELIGDTLEIVERCGETGPSTRD